MSNSLISIAPAALRTSLSLPQGANRVHAVKPVVAQATSLAPAETTRHTANPTPSEQAQANPLYTRMGTLTTGGYQAVTVDRRERFDLEITTAQGDVATLHLFQKQSAGQASVAATSAGTAAQLATYSQASLDVQYTLQGDLNPQEAASVDALVKQINIVASDFFAGNMEQAIRKAASIDISGDADTLSAYAFDLQSQETQRVAAVYANIEAATAPHATPASAASNAFTAMPSAAPADGGDKVPQSGDFLKSLLAMLESMTRSAKDLLQGQPVAQQPKLAPTVAA
jgi:hypothetical protein